MKLDANKLTSAVRLALTMGTVASVGMVGSAYAQSADSTQQKSQNLETIVVTGSNIRRVDIETANPVLTIDHAAIEKSGKLTLGDLVQALPSMAGNATNPNVNNGGGAGASAISLRGLGSSRSLLLINGHRIPTQMQDLNIIPASAVERIEVLSDGSSAVYGSDAVAGVVNIITRTNYQGAEFGADYGISDKDDGERRGYHAMFGQSTDKGSIILGVNYNKTAPVLASSRAYSHDALYKYSTGYVIHGGSSRTPNGRINLPPTNPLLGALHCSVSSATNTFSVTRLPGHTGTSPSDYRCYHGSDAFNYQAVGNYDQTPTERTGLFALGNYKLSDSAEAFVEVYHNKTVSAQQVAPVPLDTGTDGMVIPANQYYNPFGQEFSLASFGSSSAEFRTRLSSLGNRQTHFSSTHDLITTGFKGSFADSSWTWYADYSYGKLAQLKQNANYINYSKIASNFNCTTLACNPINIFNIFDPNTIAILNSAKLSTSTHLNYQYKSGEAGVSGSLFSLPAGDIQAAAGVNYTKQYINTVVDSAVLINPVDLTCSGPQSICSAPTQGGYNVKEAYAELLVPVLKDQPFVHSLNIDLGDRYSKYNLFGSTNNWKIAIEYKPIEDLLVRATVSKVFRAPSVTNLYAGPSSDSPTAVDPLHPNCAASGTCQLSGIVVGSQYANANFGTNSHVLPENGKSYDFGFVYDPSWLPGLSVNADYYRITLANLIVAGTGTAQTILNKCYAGGTTPVGPTCSLITRTQGPTSPIKFVYEAPFNSGNLETKGADIGASYRLPETPFGNFRVAAQATYIQAYNITQGGITTGYAGHFDKTYGNFARWRALANLDWNWGAFSASWQTRYVGHIAVGFAGNEFNGSSANVDGLYAGSPYKYGASVYHNVSLGYNIEPLNTSVQVGVDNLTDKTPQIFYQNNVINANVDVNTYDTVGRFFWAKLTVKF
jgi:outer membrane receptor protein involved in Fe transport